MIKSFNKINREFVNEYQFKKTTQQPVMTPGDSEQWWTDLLKKQENLSNINISLKNKKATDVLAPQPSVYDDLYRKQNETRCFDTLAEVEHLILNIQRDSNAMRGVNVDHHPETKKAIKHEPCQSFDYPAPENLIDTQKPEANQKKKKSTAKRVTDIVLCALVGFILVAATAFYINSNSGFTLFGHSCFIMLTDSMHSEIPQGALVIVKKVDADNLKIGDDITFSRNDGKTVTHRIVSIVENDESNVLRAFCTQGLNNHEPDSDIVYASDIIGVVELSVPGLGSALDYIAGNMGGVMLILGGILVTIILLSSILTTRKEANQNIFQH
jgi:signal peptidase